MQLQLKFYTSNSIGGDGPWTQNQINHQVRLPTADPIYKIIEEIPFCVSIPLIYFDTNLYYINKLMWGES